MKYLILLLLLTGCGVTADQSAERNRQQRVLFVQCMKLAADMPRQSDDDVADIISQCNTVAFYQASHEPEKTK